MRKLETISATWSIKGRDASEGEHHVTMCTAASQPCNHQCPWLVANHGKTVELSYDHEVPGIPMPEGDFAFAPWKRAHLWSGNLKDGTPGYGSLCHVRLHGTELRDDGGWEVVSRQCTGALVMQQREVLRQVAHGQSALTLEGAARVAGAMLGREVAETEVDTLDLGTLLAHAHPSVFDPAIGSAAVAPPLSEQEIQEWAADSGSG